MPTIEFTIDKAEKRGIRKGIEQGIEKGIEQGVRRGKLETAMRLLQSGVDIDDTTVCKIAQLTPEELAQLKQKIEN